MATVNTGNEWVLVIEMHNGVITEVSSEGRSVYENTKGRFIKTKRSGYSQVWLDDYNRAIIAYKNWRPTTVTITEVQNALHQMFSEYQLEGFIK